MYYVVFFFNGKRLMKWSLFNLRSCCEQILKQIINISTIFSLALKIRHCMKTGAAAIFQVLPLVHKKLWVGKIVANHLMIKMDFAKSQHVLKMMISWCSTENQLSFEIIVYALLILIWDKAQDCKIVGWSSNVLEWHKDEYLGCRPPFDKEKLLITLCPHITLKSNRLELKNMPNTASIWKNSELKTMISNLKHRQWLSYLKVSLKLLFLSLMPTL